MDVHSPLLKKEGLLKHNVEINILQDIYSAYILKPARGKICEIFSPLPPASGFFQFPFPIGIERGGSCSCRSCSERKAKENRGRERRGVFLVFMLGTGFKMYALGILIPIGVQLYSFPQNRHFSSHIENNASINYITDVLSSFIIFHCKFRSKEKNPWPKR